MYFGIGVSEISEMDADENAYLHFGKMIEVKVHSTTERVLLPMLPVEPKIEIIFIL